MPSAAFIITLTALYTLVVFATAMLPVALRIKNQVIKVNLARTIIVSLCLFGIISVVATTLSVLLLLRIIAPFIMSPNQAGVLCVLFGLCTVASITWSILCSIEYRQAVQGKPTALF